MRAASNGGGIGRTETVTHAITDSPEDDSTIYFVEIVYNTDDIVNPSDACANWILAVWGGCSEEP